MPRREFPGDPRRDADVVPYQPAVSSSEGSVYYLVSFASAMGALFLKSKWIGWVALYASLLSVFSDRASASASGGSSRFSTVTLALTSLTMTYMPELLALLKIGGAAGGSAGGAAQ
ncbi:hypothetical protein IWQ57_005151 [Coemansia nantahalensis]|uniref:Uncharacterized protein n=2 Tax=Coemansia TaxID=4863 RepID=A0ACC1LC80_9FUNG|nr:hypothetical protein IWQ57_005151 [Coemansia nantahalensis]KAJ2804657.1 hypothetical protein H4R21_001555 [Coemansia helicoidea]